MKGDGRMSGKEGGLRACHSLLSLPGYGTAMS